MADKMRWRYGDTDSVDATVKSATIIEIGDILWQDPEDGNAKPASIIGHDKTLFAQQGLVAHHFLGVAMQRSRSGDTNPIRVATTGAFEFEFDCLEGGICLGDFIGVSANNAAGILFNQRVHPVTDHTIAIGRVAKRQPTAATSVFVDIRSRIMTNGVRGR